MGRRGEDLAAAHLERAGFEVLDRNWRCADGALRGELDIVARRGRMLVVCEVKTRRSGDVDGVLEAVTPRKQQRLRMLAAAYARRLDWRPAAVRIDVIGVAWRGGGRAAVAHVPGVGEP